MISTRDSRPYGYDLMADDVVALMDVLKVPKADIVGWSDGSQQRPAPRAGRYQERSLRIGLRPGTE
jgi:pimeloyl-ACP methyl ester carboxylesterase